MQLRGIFYLRIFEEYLYLTQSFRSLHKLPSFENAFFGLIPIAGPIIVLINLCRDGTPGENKYGANPKEAAALTMNSVPQ
jgi:uncharacterized membrane protein YhaH (DUF805 family)